MTNTYKVRLIPFPATRPGTYGMAASVEVQKHSTFVPSPGVFASIDELQATCEKAQISALVMGMPTPGRIYELTSGQLAALGFNLAATA